MKLVVNELIPIYETDKGNKVVDARELHEFLGSKQEFANWIKNRIEKYGFVMDEDFLITLSKTQSGGRPSTDYILTIDTAKELAMVESNAKGRKVRKYFIEIEKRARNQPQIALPQNYVEALKALITAEEEKLTLQNKIESDKPLVHFAESLQISKHSILISDLATILRQKGYPTGEKRLYSWMRENGYLIKSGSEYNMPTQRSMELGLFEVKIGTRGGSDGDIKPTRTTKVTGKGQQYFINKLLPAA